MLNIIVLYGGASSEHEVSCRSAAFILNNLDKSKYQISPVAITKSGSWCPQKLEDAFTPNSSIVQIVNDNPISPYGPNGLLSNLKDPDNTVIFPIIHGTDGEDGKIQGLLEMAGVQYVGSDSISSGVGFDKVLSKKIAQVSEIPIVDYLTLSRAEWNASPQDCKNRIASELGFPAFVKPTRQGSSVGISKVNNDSELDAAMELSFQYDNHALIEKAVSARELECAVFSSGSTIEITDVGEIRMNQADFYDYDAKYLSDSGADVIIPAKISDNQRSLIQSHSKKIFEAMSLYGMARIDFFLEKGTENIYFNEVNTVPGFTSISQYPMLWAANGVSGSKLMDKLIESAMNR